jgi:GeoRSP system SPASM domain protein
MELAKPITVYWDLPSCLKDEAFPKRICGDILTLHPLMLQLHLADSTLDDSVVDVLKTFAGSQIAVSLTAPLACLAGNTRSLLAGLQLKELLLTSENISDVLDAATKLSDMRAHIPEGTLLGLSIGITNDNWKELPSVVAFCRANGLKRLVLPMQRLYDDETPFMLSRTGQKELQAALATVGGIEDITLTIHDPFVWKAFNPGIPFPQGGCQAANTMIAISGRGDVYPCPSLPVKLGTIGAATLKEIVASPVKKDFRRSLLEIPADCSQCAELRECRGGCRGRAYVQHDTLDGIDSSCR